MCRVPWQHVDTHTHTPWLGAHSHSETHTERTKERSFTAKLQTNWTLREEKFKDRAGAECRGGLAVFHKHTCAFQTDERLSHTGYTSQAKCILHLSHILSVAYADTPDRTASIVEEFGKAGTQMNRYLHNVPCVFLSVRTSSLMPLDLKIFHYGGVFVCASMNESEVRASEWVCSFRLQIVVFRLLTDTCVRAHYHCWEKEQSKSSSKKLEDAFSVKKTPPCQDARAVENQKRQLLSEQCGEKVEEKWKEHLLWESKREDIWKHRKNV